MPKLFPTNMYASSDERAMIAPFVAVPRPRQVSVKPLKLIVEVPVYIGFVAGAIYFVMSVWGPKSQQSSLYEKLFCICRGDLLPCSECRGIRSRPKAAG
jgi:hypothetical protein